MIIDTIKTKVEKALNLAEREAELDKSNRHFARIGLGCFPVLHICPICEEAFSTSSSLPLPPAQYGLIDGKVAHAKCLAGENDNE